MERKTKLYLERWPVWALVGTGAAFVAMISFSLAGLGSALAQEENQLSYPEPQETPAPMVLETDEEGTVLLRGQVSAVGEDTLSVESWGGTWTVRVTEGTQFTTSAEAENLSEIAVGNFVGAEGTIATDQEFTIDATFVRDWDTSPLPSGQGETPAPMVLETDVEGNVLIRGEATVVDENSVEIRSWGGTWTVRIDGETGVAGEAAAQGDLSGIEVGNFVGAEGTIATDQEFTIDATFVRDWTLAPLAGEFDGVTADVTAADDAQFTVPTADVITYSGIVGAVDDTSLTFTDDFQSTYTVFVAPNVDIVDNEGQQTELENINVGDRVELDGTAFGDTLTTDTVNVTPR